RWHSLDAEALARMNRALMEPAGMAAITPKAESWEAKVLSGFVDEAGKLCGILTNRDMRFESRDDIPAKALMTRENLVTVKEGVSQAEARDLLRRHKIERLIVVDDEYHAVGLITVQ
ncbi:CBS domain-containing protein, partial [Acinetobacter baumannii]|uniref:CBS domain-containing protein n=1 Tax=Acinetobacter baumannii TaxID=470 RepID=UPI00331F983D